jgi:hypothetical protein
LESSGRLGGLQARDDLGAHRRPPRLAGVVAQGSADELDRAGRVYGLEAMTSVHRNDADPLQRRGLRAAAGRDMVEEFQP